MIFTPPTCLMTLVHTELSLGRWLNREQSDWRQAHW